MTKLGVCFPKFDLNLIRFDSLFVDNDPASRIASSLIEILGKYTKN